MNNIRKQSYIRAQRTKFASSSQFAQQKQKELSPFPSQSGWYDARDYGRGFVNQKLLTRSIVGESNPLFAS